MNKKMTFMPLLTKIPLLPTIALISENKLIASHFASVWQYGPKQGVNITKTSLCNEDPLTPHFYIVKLGFTGVYIFFLFSF